MHLNSRGYATDLMLAGFDGQVVEGDGYIAVRTPRCPAFWWGNFVLFGAPPASGQGEEWEAVFDREVACVKGVRHRHFAWDTTCGEHGAASAFERNGYRLQEAIFLMASSVRRSRRHRADVLVRPIEGEAEWCRALEIQHESLDADRDTPSFRAFQSSQMARNRSLTERGFGAEPFPASRARHASLTTTSRAAAE